MIPKKTADVGAKFDLRVEEFINKQNEQYVYVKVYQ